MTTRYIIVIGSDNIAGDTPLARTLSCIGTAMGKETRVFVTNPTGSFEFDHDQKFMAADCARRNLSTKNEKDCRLLLFDAVSKPKWLEPAAGMLPWLSYYYAIHGYLKPSYINFESIITKFFFEETKGIWWTGFVSPSKYTIQTLADNNWDQIMRNLTH